MSEVEIRRLNEKGLEKFAMDVWGHQPNGEPPYDILHDDEYSEVVIFSNSNSRKIDSDVIFRSGIEMVNLLDSAFGKNVELTDVIEDEGMWAWLALLYYGNLRAGGPGNWKKAAQPRFIPSGAGLRYYRHMISGRYAVWKMYGSDAMVFLHGEANIGGEIGEQIISTSPIVTSHSVVKALNTLYYDPSKSKGFKKGVGGKGGGSARRFRTVFWQLYETYDLRTMDSETILSLLPNEFDRFQPETVGDGE
jgi:hypothetical protein